MALKWNTTYPTDIIYGSTHVDEVKWTVDGAAVTQWTRPINSISYNLDNWLIGTTINSSNKNFVLATEGYTDDTHRGAYTNALCFYKDTIRVGFFGKKVVINSSDQAIITNADNSTTTKDWDDKYYYIPTTTGYHSISLNTSAGTYTRGDTTSLTLSGLLSEVFPPTINSMQSISVAGNSSNYDVLSWTPSYTLSSQANTCKWSFTPAMVCRYYNASTSTFTNKTITGSVQTVAYTGSNQAKASSATFGSNETFVKTVSAKMNNIAYSIYNGSSSSYNTDGAVSTTASDTFAYTSYSRPAQTITVSAGTAKNYITNVNLTLSRGAVAQDLGVTTAATKNQANTTNFTVSGYPYDTYSVVVTGTTGWKTQTLTGTISRHQSSLVYNTEPQAYTFKLTKGTGVATLKVSITRGTAGDFVGASDVSNSTTLSHTTYYGDTYSYTTTANTGYTAVSKNTTSITGNINTTVNATPTQYTLTLSKGTGVSALKVSITRGTIGKAAGASDVNNSTTLTHTVYYGDTYTPYVTGTTGYTTGNLVSNTITGNVTRTVDAFATLYSLTVNKGTGVASTSTNITRGTIGLAEGESNVSNGTAASYIVYYGDSYQINATASTGYNTPSSTSTTTITGNKTVTMTTTPIAYTLTVSKGTGVASTKTSITRGTIGQGAGASNVSNGTASSYTVYRGDTYTCGGTASTGYNTPTTSSAATITASKTHTVTTTAIAYTLTLSKGTGVSDLKVSITRGTAGQHAGASNVSNSTTLTHTVYYGDTYTPYVTGTTGYSTGNLTTNTITGNVTRAVDALATTYTLTISKGTGVASTSTNITRGTIGQGAGASNVSSGTATSYIVYYGDTYTCGGTANTGYNTPSTSASATITASKTHTVTTTAITYTLTVSKGTGVASTKTSITRGTIGQGAGASNVSNGTASSYTVYRGDTYTCGGTASTGYLTPPDSVTATITGNKTFTVTTTPITYTLTLSNGTGVSSLKVSITRGTIGKTAGESDVGGSTTLTHTVYYGDTYTPYVYGTTGYSTGNLTTNTITGNVTRAVDALPAIYTLTVSKGTGVASTKTTITRGTIGQAAGASNVSSGTATSYIVYYGDTYTCGGTASTGYLTPPDSVTATITGNKTHTVTTSAATYTLTISKGTGVASTKTTITRGTIGQGAGASDVSNGTNSSYTVYYGDTYTCGGTASTGYNTPTTSSSANITGNKTHTVTTTAIAYTLTISKGTGVASTSTNITRGTIGQGAGASNVSSGTAASYTVYHGDTYQINATASTGYNTPPSTSTTAITGNKTVTMTTTPIAYTLTISKGTGVASTSANITRGTIGQAAGASNVSSGTAASYTVYRGDTYQINGTASTGYNTPSSTSTTTITGNKTVTITTTPKVYTLTATKGNHVSTGAITITRGTIGQAAGASNISGTAGNFTSSTKTFDVYYGDTVGSSGVAETGYAITYLANATVTSNMTRNITAYARTFTHTVKAAVNSSTYYGSRTITITRGSIAQAAGATDVDTTDTIATSVAAYNAYNTGVSYTLYYGDVVQVNFSPSSSTSWSMPLTYTQALTAGQTTTYSVYAVPTVTKYVSNPAAGWSDATSNELNVDDDWIKITTTTGPEAYTVDIYYNYDLLDTRSERLKGYSEAKAINISLNSTKYAGSGIINMTATLSSAKIAYTADIEIFCGGYSVTAVTLNAEGQVYNTD